MSLWKNFSLKCHQLMKAQQGFILFFFPSVSPDTWVAEVKGWDKTTLYWLLYWLNCFRFTPGEHLISDKNSCSLLVNSVWIHIFTSHLPLELETANVYLWYFVGQGNILYAFCISIFCTLMLSLFWCFRFSSIIGIYKYVG